jgi:hypothetical protein
MKQNLKHIQQFKQAKAGIKLFYQNSLLITDYEDLQNHLNILASYFEKSKNDKAKNKNVILFKTYLKNEAEKNQLQKIKNQKIIKNISHRMTFKDCIEDYYILRNRGLSYKAISEYSKKHYKVQVSKETVRKYLTLNEVHNEK